MKKMLIIIVILATILTAMIIYKNTVASSKKNINIQEIQNIEDSISKIYLWKEITGEALVEFENINDANDTWVWETVKKNIEKFEVKYEEIEQSGKEIFGNEFNKKFPREGNKSFNYNEEKDIYFATEIELDQMEDSFLISNIENTKDGYEVIIIEYLEDYSNEEKVIIKNTDSEEIGQVNVNDSETKVQETIKENISRFSKKKLYFKLEDNKLTIQKVEKIQE